MARVEPPCPHPGVLCNARITDATSPAQHHQTNPDAAQTPGAVSVDNRHTENDHTNRPRNDDVPASIVTAEIPESANTYRMPKSSSSQLPPRLSSSNSAPASNMATMIQPSPSQKAFADMTRASSFHGFPGGDTQPMESQVYRDYTESMAHPASQTTVTPSKKTVSSVQISLDGKANTYDTTVTDKTPKTCVEGETGYIDLEQAWQPGSPTAQSTSDIDELLASPQTQMHAPELFARPTMPETPAMAGHKRNSDGELLSPTTATTKKTPGFSQLFGAVQNGPVLSATQLFNQTQAPSSPIPDAPRSDPVLTRPSPNLQQPFSRSSPAAGISSPVAVMHGRPTTTLSEPRDNYMSMRESQERRSARLREEKGMTRVDDDDESEDGYSQRRRLEQMKLQRALSEQDMTRFRAPPRASSRPSSGRKVPDTVDLVTPAPTHKYGKVDFESSSDEGSDGEAPLPDDHHADDDGHNEDDVYDELGQAVLRSQSNIRDDLEEDQAPEDLVHEEDTADGRKSNEDHPNEERSDYAQPDEPNANGDVGELRVAGTQRSAMADSQPERSRQLGRLMRHVAVTHSSMSSFVPGSQYAGKTSQELARLTPTGLKNLSASQPTGSGNDDKVPSSPPLPQHDSTLQYNTAEASLARREVLATFQPRRDDAEPGRIDTIQEIPDSDLPGSDNVEAAFETAPQKQSGSNSIPPFSTAQTHLSAIGQSPSKHRSKLERAPLKMFASQQSRLSNDSPRRAAGIRRFASIAADPSPPELDDEMEQNIEAVMSDILTVEDQQYFEAVSSPPRERVRKRRKLTSQISGTRTRSGLPEKQCDERVVDGPSQQPHPPPVAYDIDDAQPDAAAHVPVVLRDIASVANEPPASTPENSGPPKGTQDSVRKREAAGAQTVSQLLSARTTRKRKNSKSLKKAVIPSTGEAATSQAKSRSRTRAGSEHNEGQEDDNGRVIGEDPVRGLEKAASEPAPDSTASLERDPQSVQAIENPTVETSTAPVCAPHRVFAHFGGKYNAFYPASWLATSADGNGYRVRFDDTTDTIIDTHLVRILDLRVGDQVKVDGSGLRNKSWIIQSFGPVAETKESKALGTDVYGRVIARVQAKASRSSMTASSVAAQGEGDVLEVLITNVYLTQSMWPHFADRRFLPPTDAKRMIRQAETPSSGVHTPNVETPGSRTRRAALPSAKVRASHLRETPVTSFDSPRVSRGIFSGMAFAISYGANEVEKTAVIKDIQRHGGLILENGFDELFESPRIQGEILTPSPKKRSPRKSNAATELPADDEGVRLKTEHQNLGFVALIADRHSRRAKYMQALALGLPTLSGRWIMDSLNPSRNSLADSAPLPWSKYLLPAGDSAYLGGAVRSRTIPVYNAEEARLADAIAKRELLLHGDGVLIVAGSSSKKSDPAWQRRKTYAFLTLALGAGRIRRVGDLHEAKEMISSSIAQDGDLGTPTWKWVYVDGDVVDASSVLFGRKNAAANNKRKRGGGKAARKGGEQTTSASDGRVKVVNDEYVVQSLILGALVD